MFLLFVLASTALGACDVTERKTCKGKAQKLDLYDREHAEARPTYSKNGKKKQEWCQKMCEYYGVEGCCAWDVIDALDVNIAECYFVAGGSPVTDNAESKKVVSFGYPVEYKITPLKYGGKCTWSGKQEMIFNDRKTGCDYDGVDKEGRRALGGAGHTEAECKKFCMDGDCVHASLSSSGYCHTFMTCNWSEISFDHGAKMWQKVNSAAPTTYVAELESCCMEYGKCMRDGYCNASKERCEGRCNRKNGKKTWRDATAEEATGDFYHDHNAARAGEESIGREKGSAPPCPECYRRMQGECRRDSNCIPLAEQKKDCILVTVGDKLGSVSGDWCRVQGAGNYRCGVGALCCKKGVLPKQVGDAYDCPGGSIPVPTDPPIDKSKINGGNDPARQWNFKCRVGGSKSEGMCDTRKPKSASDSCRNCMYGKIDMTFNDWCCTFHDYKTRNKFDHSGRCFCTDEWERWAEEAVGAGVEETSEETMQTAESRPSVMLYGFAMLGLGAILYGAGRYYCEVKRHTIMTSEI